MEMAAVKSTARDLESFWLCMCSSVWKRGLRAKAIGQRGGTVEALATVREALTWEPKGDPSRSAG